jgi:hypothetical protein
VLTLRSGRPVTGAGVEQAAASPSNTTAIYNFFMTMDLGYYINIRARVADWRSVKLCGLTIGQFAVKQ